MKESLPTDDKWIQLDFGPPVAPEPKKKRRPNRTIDYEAIAIAIGDKEVSTQELREFAGLGEKESVNLVRDFLTINYTLYSERKGFYKMLKPVKKKEN